MLIAIKSRVGSIINLKMHRLQISIKRKESYKCTQNLNQFNLNHNSIILSQSRDIYENLAFEDWLYKNLDFSAKGIFVLLLWYNGPSVVVGRHQNPWVECSVDFCRASGISIARRNSGGGTVYHDLGNINFSFLTPRKEYNRKKNLVLLSDAIKDRWPVNLTVTKRDDIICNGKYKVSGTAAKLGRNNAYHHCTILVDVDEINLHQALHRDVHCVKSKATASVKAEVINLNSVCPDITTVEVLKTVTDSYKQIYKVKDVLSIYPNENICAGLEVLQQNLKSWDWCFGHTPRFTVTKRFPICSSFSKWKGQNLPLNIEIILTSNKGTIENISLNPEILEEETFVRLKQFIIDQKFSEEINFSLDKWVKTSKNKIICKFIKCCIVQMVLDVYR